MILINFFLAILLVGMVVTMVARSKYAGIIGCTTILGLSTIGIYVGIHPIVYGSSIQLGQFIHADFEQVSIGCDGLSAWFMVLTSVLFILGSFYGKGYLKHYEARGASLKLHWISLSITLSGMLTLFTTDNLITFLIGWEMMAIGSFIAVIFEGEKSSIIKSGLNYFVQSHIAVLCLTVAFAWIYSETDVLTYDGVREFFHTATTGKSFGMMMLFTAGFGFKAGLIPFHSWLPHAHPAAPSHVSALMSGIIVKAGIYGLIRFSTFIENGQMSCGVAILSFGVLSGLYGIVNAAVHRDFKRMLAYCTIENVGIITMGIGLGILGGALHSPTLTLIGYGAALLHTMNHAIFKALLFFGAGNIYISTHTRNMEELGGLGKQMPHTMFIFLIGSLAIGGLPPFGGFASEFLIYNGMLFGFNAGGLTLPIIMALSGGALAIIGGISMLAFTKSFGVIFLGTPRSTLHKEPHEVSNEMKWPSIALLIITFLTICLPGYLFYLTTNITAQLMPSINEEYLNSIGLDYASLLEAVGNVLMLVLIFVACFIIIRYKIVSRRPVRANNTWGCGYAAPIKGIQYTSKSFSQTLIGLFRFILPHSTRYRQLTTEEIFPQDRSHISADADFFEHDVITPSTDKMFGTLGRFQFVQNGNLQRYIVYGLAYTIILVASATLL